PSMRSRKLETLRQAQDDRIDRPACPYFRHSSFELRHFGISLAVRASRNHPHLSARPLSRTIEIPMTPHDVLEKYFGFREFLDAQEEVITAIAGGADALVVMPTGGGKSLCYQLPALLLEGTTIVVSPLIALMKDQVDALERRGISATLINSTLTPGEQQERIRALAR